MRYYLDVYRVLINRSLVIQFQYRASMSIWLLGRVIEPLMFLVVWQTIAESKGGSVGSYSTADFAAYYIIVMMVSHLTFTWIMHEFEHLVRQGTLSTQLLRPVHPIHEAIADNVAYKMLTVVIMLPVAFLLAWLFEAAFDFQLWTILAFIPALLLAALLRFITGWTLALGAFWITRVQAINSLYFVSMFFFAGRLAPLELFPDWVRTLASLTPFPWMLLFPVELLLGRLSVQDTLLGFGIQIVWLVICFGLMRVIWTAGVKHFSAVGA
ncbi:MAG: ABC-2 family transporter protein [Chloroflexota bacterium]